MANKLTEVRFNRRYDAAQLLAYYTNKNFPDDWTDGMFLQASNSPNRLYYFAKKTVDGQTAMAMTIVGEKNAITGIKIQGGATLTGEVEITRASLDVYSTDEVNKKIEGAVSSLYTPKGDILREDFKKLKYKDVKDGWVYNVKENADDKGKSYAAVKTPGYYRTNDPTNGRKEVDPDWVYPYTTQLAYFTAPANDCQAVAQQVRALIPGDAANDGFYVDVYMMADSASGKYWLIGVNPDKGQFWLVPNASSPTLSGDDNYPYQAFASKPDAAHISGIPYTSDGQQANDLKWTPMGGEFDTSGLATKEEFDAFVAYAKALHVRLEDELNRILTQYDEVQNAALVELHQDLEAISSNFGAQTPGGIPKIGNLEGGWQSDDYIVTTDGSGNIVAVYKYGTAASKNTGLQSGRLPEMKETIGQTSKQQGTYPAVYKDGGLGITANPLGSAAFKDVLSAIPTNPSSSDDGKLPMVGAVRSFVEQQVGGVQEKLVNVLVQQDQQFADKAALDEYVDTHLASIKSGFVYNVLDTDMNYAVRKQTTKQLSFVTLNASFAEDKMYNYSDFGSWLNGVLGSGREIGTIVVSQFYNGSGERNDGNGEPLNVYVMKHESDSSLCYLFVMNENYGTYWLSHHNDDVIAVKSSQGRAAVDMTETLFTLDPLGAEFDPKTLGTASTKNYGTAAGNLPEIGTALPKSANRIVLTDNNGKLKPSTLSVGDAAYKGVAQSIAEGGQGLPTSDAVWEYTHEAVEKMQKFFTLPLAGSPDISQMMSSFGVEPGGSVNLTIVEDEEELGMQQVYRSAVELAWGEPSHLLMLKSYAEEYGITVMMRAGGTLLPCRIDTENDGIDYLVVTTVTPEGVIVVRMPYQDSAAWYANRDITISYTEAYGTSEKADKLTNKTAISGVLFDGSQNVNGYFVETGHQTTEQYELKSIDAANTFHVGQGSRLTVRFTAETTMDNVMLRITNCNVTSATPILQGGENIGQRLQPDVYDLVYDTNGLGTNQPAWLVVSGGGGGRLYWED